jgi:hypothetical protein
MATPGKAPFQKRQKEMARKDKQLRKVERRAQRKLDNSDSDNGPSGDSDSSVDQDNQKELEIGVLDPISERQS